MTTPAADCQQTQYANITHALAEQGWHTQAGFLTETQIRALKTELDNLGDTQLTPAGIGNDRRHRIAPHIRSDKTCWLTGQTPTQKNLLDKTAQLRQHLNRELYLGLRSYEAHYAYYKPGACYHKHLDAFQSNNARKISTVIYLNENWQPEYGGELILYHPENNTILQRILPNAGTLVTFISEQYPHEVLPAIRPRYSIAGWYRTDENLLSSDL